MTAFTTAAQIVDGAAVLKGVEDVILLKYETSMIEDEDLELRGERCLARSRRAPCLSARTPRRRA